MSAEILINDNNEISDISRENMERESINSIFLSPFIFIIKSIFSFTLISYVIGLIIFDELSLCKDPFFAWLVFYLLKQLLTFYFDCKIQYFINRRNNIDRRRIKSMNSILFLIKFFLILILFFITMDIFDMDNSENCINNFVIRYTCYILAIFEICVSLLPSVFSSYFPCIPIALRLANYSSGFNRLGSTNEEIELIPEYNFRGNCNQNDFEIENEDIYIDDFKSNCIICLDEYKEDDTIKLLRCNHHFHSKCINDWLKISCTCPFCRRNAIIESDNDSSSESDENNNTLEIDNNDI